MKISQILNEGVIKVPKSTLDDTMVIVGADIFSRLFAFIEDDEDSLEYKSFLKNIMKKFEKRWGRFQLFDGHTPDQHGLGKVYIRMGELDKRYIRNPNDKSKIFTIQVAVGHTHGHNASAAYYQKSPGKPSRIAIRLPEPSFLMGHLKNPEFLDTLFDRILGVVEHELMHAIQDMGLKILAGKAGAYYNADGSLKWDEYYASEIEFGPQVVTSFHEFEALLKDHSLLGHDITPQIIKAMMWKFLSPEAAPAKFEDGTSWKHTDAFMGSLYRQDKTKWKKAVKYFYGLYQNSKEKR